MSPEGLWKDREVRSVERVREDVGRMDTFDQKFSKEGCQFCILNGDGVHCCGVMNI